MGKVQSSEVQVGLIPSIEIKVDDWGYFGLYAEKEAIKN